MSPDDRSGQPRARTFLLTLWREREDELWRAAMRTADGAVRLGFGDLEQLAEFLLSLDDRSPVTGSVKRET